MRQAAVSILTCVQRKRQMPRCHALLLVLLAQVAIASPSASLDLVIASIDQGQFKQAQTMIDAGLAQTSLAAETRTSLRVSARTHASHPD
jgi:hypothetical protein